MEFKNEIERLNFLLKSQHKSMAELTELLGVSATTLYFWITNRRGMSVLRDKTRRQVCIKLGVSYDWLRYGTGEMYANEQVVDDRLLVDDNILTVDVVDIKVELGLTTEIKYYKRNSSVPYRKSLFEKLKAEFKNCKIFTANDNAMSPMIDKGDFVMFDFTHVADVNENNVYLLVTKDSVIIRKLKYDKESYMVNIISLNAAQFELEKLAVDEFRTKVIKIFRVIRIEKNLI